MSTQTVARGATADFNRESKAHLPALDGLRGLAVLLVLCSHVSERFFEIPHPWRLFPMIGYAGWTGVDLFFVLSGFLITGILWESRTARHYFRNFYMRRTLRLFPLYYGTLLVIFVIWPLLLPHLNGNGRAAGSFAAMIRETNQRSPYWIWYIAYSVNFLVAQRGIQFPSHFWTLAVEEQFYLVWPLLIHRLERSKLLVITGALVVGALILRLALHPFVPQLWLYVLTPCQIDGLALGALIALLMRGRDGAATLRRIARVSFPVLAAMSLLLGIYLRGWRQWGLIEQTAGYSLTVWVWASMLILTLVEPPWTRAFSSRWLRFLGKYSYGIYVIHPFAINFSARLFDIGSGQRFPLLDSAGFVVAAFGLPILLAMISWRVLEQPFLRLKSLFPYDSKRPASGAELVGALARAPDTTPAPGPGVP